MFKYELNQLIYYIRDNKVHSARVLARIIVENVRDESIQIGVTRDIFNPFGKQRVQYGTCHGIIDEKDVFPSREELLEAL